MSAATIALDFENSIFSIFDNLKQSVENGNKSGIANDVAAMVSFINAGIAGVGFVAQTASYVSGGGNAANLAPFLERLSGFGLAFDFATSLVNLGALYNTYSSNPNFENSHNLDIALGKLLLQTVTAGVFFAAGGLIAASLAFGIVGQLADPRGLVDFGDMLAGIYGGLLNKLSQVRRDPIVLDLDGDGVELTPLDGSTVHFDFTGDGRSELTGWVGSDDGILAIDDNDNGVIDNGFELFGSAIQDGFAVLETLDSNGDGRIDASDSDFNKLRIWRDLNQNGVSESNELQTLSDAGIASISLSRQVVDGSNAGHHVGFEAIFTRSNGIPGVSQSIYFDVDLQSTTEDNTPMFSIGEGVGALPQLAGSGLINSIAYKATIDSEFFADWISLADRAIDLSPAQLREELESLLLRWADVEGIDIGSRGPFVDARHLSFIEKFFGDTYREFVRGEEVGTYPSRPLMGAEIEASFHQIIDVLETMYLSQVGYSLLIRGGDITADTILKNPYFFYMLLDFSPHGVGDALPATPGNVGAVVNAVVSLMPGSDGPSAEYLIKALTGLNGVVGAVFGGDRQAYANVVVPCLSNIQDIYLRDVATQIAHGTAFTGTVRTEGFVGTSDGDVFLGGGGGDLVNGASGSDIYIYGKHDGDLWIKDAEGSLVDTDRLFLTDLNSTDVSFERYGDNLLIKVAGTGKTIVSEDFFSNFTTQHRGIDIIRFADGAEWDRTQIKNAAIFKGDDHNNLVRDSSSDDVIYGGRGNDLIQISQGNDTILYAKGDGYDVIQDRDLGSAGREVFHLTDLNSSDIELSRVGPEALILTVKATGEYIQFDQFFTRYGSIWSTYKGNIDEIKFANGEVWDRGKIQENAWYRGTNRGESLSGGDLDDTIDGGKGDDFLEGWYGSDTFIWRKGDGNDQISDISGAPVSDVDTLYMVDVTSDDVAFSYQGDTLLITVRSTGEVIRVQSFFSGVSNLHQDAYTTRPGIDIIKFADGETLDRQQIYTLTGQEFLGKDREVHSYYIDVEGVSTLVWMYFTDEFGHSGDFWGNMAPGNNDVYDQQIYGVADWNFNIGEASNILNGGKGNNILAGGGGQDILYGGEGDGRDTLYGDRPGDASYGNHDVLDGGGGADMLFGGGGSDVLNGGSGNDYLSGDDGIDILDGGGGNDIYVGGKGDDFLSGDLAVTGASGSDTYIYSLGDGNDVIAESLDWPGTDIDVLEFTDVNSSDIELRRVGNDLEVWIRPTGEIIRVLSQFSGTINSNAPGGGIELIRFADGIEWKRSVIQQNAWYRGTDGRDVIVTGGNLTDQDDNILSETIEGGKGDDLLYTGYQSSSGNDTFVYSRGDGNDVIYEQTWRSTFGTTHNETDTLKFTDIDSSDVRLTRSGNDLLVTVISTNETITIIDQFAEDVGAPGEGLEYIRFANGEGWGRDRIQKEAWFRGTDGRDLIDVQAGNWNDIIEGGKGDDIIVTGNMSASGSDTYVYSSGDGNDVITDRTWAHFAPNEIDILKLSDINVAGVELSRSGNDLLIKVVSTDEVIKIVDQFAEGPDSPGEGLEYIQFANGERWGRDTISAIIASQVAFIVGSNQDDLLTGTPAAQNIYGETGNDVIDGRGGSDLLYGGLGNDILKIGVSATGDLVTAQGGAGNDTLDVSEFGSAVWLDLVTNGAELRTRDQADLSTGTWRDMAQVDTVENVIGTSFADEIYGDAGDNKLVGNSGDDIIEGRSGTDHLIGGDGNDTLTGGMGDDLLDGGAGADSLNGGLDNDILVGGAGNDVLAGGTGSDVFVFDAGFGSDVITDFTVSGADADLIRFDSSLFNDFVSVMAAASQVGPDVVISNGGNSLTLQNVTLSSLSAQNFDFHRLNNQAPSAIEMSGGSVAENAAAGTVVATLSAVDADAADSHTFSLAASNDFFEIVGSEVRLKAGVTLDFETASQHSLTIIATDDEGLSVTSQVSITVDDVDDIETGSAADDAIYGGAGIDIISGGGGTDLLSGFAGSDIYIYNPGDGEDRIVDEGNPLDNDELVIGDGISEGNVVVGRASLTSFDVVLQLSGGGLIVLQNQLSDVQGSGVEEIRFADDITWTRSDILARLDPRLIIGTSQNDVLSGSALADVFLSSGGNDVLRGNDGGDSYRFSGLFGQDRIVEGNGSGVDEIKLLDLNADDVMISRSGDDLVISVGSTSNSITVTDQFAWANSGIEQIVFADGSTLSKSQIRSIAAMFGTSGDDVMTGSDDDNVMRGGSGNDTLNGGIGNDTYVYYSGDGNDVINDGADRSTFTDVLVFGDLDPSDLLFTRQGDDLAIGIVGTGQTVTITKQFSADRWGIEKVQFANGQIWDRSQIFDASWIRGTAGNDTINGSSDADRIDGGAGNDALSGRGGSDVYLYGVGSGNDTITENGSDSGTDAVRLTGLNVSDVTFSRASNNLLITIVATGEVLTVLNHFSGTDGIDQLAFADGTIWNRADIAAHVWINGTSGNDTLNGTSGDDIFHGGAGDDHFNSGAGSDTYIYALGDGNDYIDDENGSTVAIDTLRFTDLNADDLTFSRVGVNLVVTVNANGQTITLDEQFYSKSANWGLERVEFADGSSWDLATLNSHAWYRGTSGNDTMSGSSWNDTFYGGLGDDRFNSGEGSDTYVYSLGDGNDYIDDENRSTTDIDTVRFTDLNASDLTFSRAGVHLVITVNSNGQTITLDEQFYSQTDFWGLEKIEFANGSSWDRSTLNSNAWYRGTSGNDTISGSSWNDTIYGDSGNDTLSGADGDDTFVFRPGSGQDTVTDFSIGHDKLQFQGGVFADAAAAFAAASASGNDTLITMDASNQVLLKNVALGSLHVDDFRVV